MKHEESAANEEQPGALWEPGEEAGEGSGVPFRNEVNELYGHEQADRPLLMKVLGFSAYSEGWALYSEQLADEMGVYADNPIGQIGYLQSLLFRATRLVADSGLHHKRWSREQTIRYMVETLGDSETAVTTEVERYCVWPGQASSYKVGHNKWVELRSRAQAALGDRFDIKDFHAVVLGSGSVPLDVLEDQVDGWIAAGGGAPTT